MKRLLHQSLRHLLYIGLLAMPLTSFAESAPVSKGMLFWFVASEGITLTEDDKVHTWADHSGNGFVASRDGENGQPMVVPDVINELPIIRFDHEVGESLRVNTEFEYGLGSSLFAVYLDDGGNGEQSASLFSYQRDNNGPAWGVDSERSAFVVRPRFEKKGAIAQRSPSVIGSPLLGEAHYLDESPAHDQSTGEVGLNGLLQPFVTTTPMQSAPGKTNAARIGRGGSGFFNGGIAELIVYERNLPQDERQVVRRYLAEKYGIDLAQPAGNSESSLEPE